VIPGNLSKPYTWFQRSDQDATGRRKRTYAERSTGTCAVAAVEARERLKWGQMGHVVSHNVVFDREFPGAKPGDYFLVNGERFYARATEDPGELGIVLLWKCEKLPDRDELSANV
jgi:hypothetical protein